MHIRTHTHTHTHAHFHTVNIEPMLEGEYVKHNDNDGHVDTNDMYPQVSELNYSYLKLGLCFFC